MKIYICEEVGSVYWLSHGQLMCAPLSEDNTFDTEEGYGIEESHFLKDEPVGEEGNDKTLGQVWEEARKVLS